MTTTGGRMPPREQMEWIIDLANLTSPDMVIQSEIVGYLNGIPIDTGRVAGLAYLLSSIGCHLHKAGFRSVKDCYDIIAPIIRNLADGKHVVMDGKIETTISFVNAHNKYGKTVDPRYRVKRHEETRGGFAGVVRLLLVHLLEEYASKIRRCQHCRHIFLQVKRNARYCTFRCSSVEGMRRIRKLRANV